MQPPTSLPTGATSAPATNDARSNGPFELRPDAQTFWRGVRFRALIFLPLFAVTIYRFLVRGGTGLAFVLYVALAIVLVVAVRVMLNTSSVVLTATTVEKHRKWLPPKIVQRSDITAGVLVPQYRSAYNRTAPLLVLAGATGRPLLRLTGQVFGHQDLFAFAERMGYQHFDIIEGVVGPKVVAQRHRKMIPLIERRPALLIVVGIVLLLVLVVVGVSIFDPVPH